ncbi:hypothetical protein LWF15_02030 [Kineosporia rhizophila]|uniref:FtsX-like permease family protein n=1 Tax=Kineosporia rhizophila TaxID=84633 RepID=UPI001E5E1483|nr:FtsX-like permease family protein [Kineosporia rhizophila]MCE0534278.1 hypothetical protein [Kineosporia rhizophila]
MRQRIVFWRAALRIARRDAWRNKGRSALIALMIALPVLVMASVSVLYRSDVRDPQDNVRVALGVQAQARIAYVDGTPIVQSPTDNGTQYVSEGTVGSAAAAPTPEEFEAEVGALIPARDRLVRDRTFDSNRNLRWQDRFLALKVREFDYTASGVKGLVEQESGRAPEEPGEVVVSDAVADTGVKAGDELVYRPSAHDPEQRLKVVGVVSGLDLDRQVIGLPGSLFPEDAFATQNSFISYGGAFGESRLLVVGPDPVTWDAVLDINQRGATVLSRHVVENPPPSSQVAFNDDDYGLGQNGDAVGIAAVAVGLILLQIALLAGPAIAVGARRNQRTLALMVAAGAEPKHLRTLVLATNGLIGLVSSAVAAAVGVPIGIGLVEVARAFGTTVVRVDIRLTDLAVLVAVGGLTAAGASLFPARQAARLDVVAALTGRRGYHPPALRVPVAGLLITLAGAALAVFGSSRRWAFVTVLGLGVAEVGMVLASGAVVALAARLAVRSPFTIRFALRDAARQRSRTAPAVAAVLAAIAGGSAALVYVAAQDDHDRRDYRATAVEGVLTVGASGYAVDEVIGSMDRAEAIVRDELPVKTVQPLRTPAWSQPDGEVEVEVQELRPPDRRCPGEEGTVLEPGAPEAEEGWPGACYYGRNPVGTLDSAGSIFDDGSALRILTGGRAASDEAALRAGSVVTNRPELIWPDGRVHVLVHRYDQDGNDLSREVIPLKAVRSAPGQLSLDGIVYPVTAAEELGISLQDIGFVADMSRMPTKDEEEAANDLLLARTGLEGTVERGYTSQYALGQLALLIACAVISLVGTFTAVGLAAAEARADVATLAAVGAGPGVRRRLAAAQAGVISGLGGILGVLSGILAGWILVRMQQDWAVEYGGENLWRLALPGWYLLAVAVGIPLLATTIAFAATRSRLTMVRRLGQ